MKTGMRTTFLGTMAAALLVSSAGAAEFAVDPAHSEVMFKVKHLAISTVTGSFRKFEGTLTAEKGNPAALAIKGTVSAASVDSNVEKRDDHLRSPDFFAVEEHPEITFASTQTTSRGGDKVSVVGDLYESLLKRRVRYWRQFKTKEAAA